MLYLDEIIFKSATFTTKQSPGDTYFFTGYGQDPTTGVNYIGGMKYDSVNNRTIVSTHLLKDILFVGNLIPTKK
jgi:hypothetical protein